MEQMDVGIFVLFASVISMIRYRFRTMLLVFGLQAGSKANDILAFQWNRLFDVYLDYMVNFHLQFD